jgi:hypothetical protein
MVSQLETDRRLYTDLLALAARTGDDALAAKMRAYGEPPYNDVFAMAFVIQQYDAPYRPYDPPAAYIERGSASSSRDVLRPVIPGRRQDGARAGARSNCRVDARICCNRNQTSGLRNCQGNLAHREF